MDLDIQIYIRACLFDIYIWLPDTLSVDVRTLRGKTNVELHTFYYVYVYIYI